MNFRKFWGLFNNDGIYEDHLYLWSNEKIKFKAKDLRFTVVTFWKFLAVKYSLEIYWNQIEPLSPFRHVVGKFDLNFIVFIFLIRSVERWSIPHFSAQRSLEALLFLIYFIWWKIQIKEGMGLLLAAYSSKSCSSRLPLGGVCLKKE